MTEFDLLPLIALGLIRGEKKQKKKQRNKKKQLSEHDHNATYNHTK